MTFKSRRFLGNDRMVSASLNAPPMKKGEAGQAVRLVQQALIDLGHPMPISTAKYGSPDGIYGSETRSAAWAFQNKHKDKLKRDGIVGAMTLDVMDNLLWNRPWTPLPDIPDPAAPGNYDDPEANARQIILETLGSGLMASMNLSMRHSPITGAPQSVHIMGFHYQKIGEALYNDRITVVLDRSIGPAALYDHKNEIIKLSRPLRRTFNDRSLIIHEATHAVCDGLGRPMNALFSEMVGFAAEGQYARIARGSPKKTGNDLIDKVYAQAFEIAALLSKGKRPELDDFGLAIRQEPVYDAFTYGTVIYDGIP